MYQLDRLRETLGFVRDLEVQRAYNSWDGDTQALFDAVVDETADADLDAAVGDFVEQAGEPADPNAGWQAPGPVAEPAAEEPAADEQRLREALATQATVEAYLADHPWDAGALLAIETGPGGKARAGVTSLLTAAASPSASPA